MTTISLLPPNPQTIHLSTGDVAVTFGFNGKISDTTLDPAVMTLEIIGDPNVVFAGGKASVSWQQQMTNDSQQFSTKQTFHLAGSASGATPLALKLTAKDKSNIPITSNTHVIYF